MDTTQWLIFILIIQVIHFLGTWKLYVKAGRKAWEAAVPVYNAIVLMQIINRPKWWVILLFIPIINLLMFPVIWVETIRSFGRTSLPETWLVILTLGFYIYYVNYKLDVEHVKERSLHPRSVAGEWVSSIVFAIVAATLVHTYFIQPYVIPTGSLERTLRIGDLLFVSKFHYGARTPMTAVAAPMVHDTLPLVGLPSYIRKPQIPYFRLPGFKDIKRKEIVVFSWPADTVRQFHKREAGVIKPIDKKSNYVKRCVGLPGDSLQIIDGYVYANGKQLELPDRAKPMYNHVVTVDKNINNYIRILGRENLSGLVTQIPVSVLDEERPKQIVQALKLNEIRRDSSYVYFAGQIGDQRAIDILKSKTAANMALVNLVAEDVKGLVKKNGIVSIERFNEKNPHTRVFPHDRSHAGTVDNFGPFYIPKRGATIPLTVSTLPWYKKIIKDYEHNTLSVKGNQVLLNGEVASSYTFKQDYYWMMGDNRHSSEDSRMWGYVPENHIVGTPIFIWMSFDNFVDAKGNMNKPWKWKPRWDRIFTTVNGTGEPVSYFKYFLIALAGWFAFDFFRKKRKQKKS
ncbi:signal peptidase I [Maribacter algarum]|uniref:Signal peptidase I n=1 Tax=Maribacter algarum (ex Zhang et al. 2020) TaxID=2578118 RepID=A0A5S3PHV1_9FLAO|nr:signal peptidase I [Maribacter algarum]TMM53848.1 signal peptidase I [Maribacter algarum]